LPASKVSLIIDCVTLPEILKQTAARFPHRNAVVSSTQKFTYRQLQKKVNRLSYNLRRINIRAQDRVALLLFNSPEFIISYFAVVKIQAVVVPINHMLKIDEVRFILQDSGACALITSTEFLDMAKDLKASLETLNTIIIVGERSFAETRNFYELIDTGFEEEIKTSTQADDEEDVVILYTSGTTGHPRGAILTHKNLISNVRACVNAIEAVSEDNFVCLLPMFHSFAWTVCVLMSVYVGAGIVVIESLRHFSRVLRSVIKNKVTVFTGIPSIYNILSRIHFSKRLLSSFSIRVCISGAAALPVEVLRNFQARYEVPLLEGYGLTEASPVVSLNPMKGRQKAGSVGVPIEGVEVKVVDDNGRDLPRGKAGELCVKGPNVMKGYLHLPQATAEIIKEEWLFTGDIARIDGDGYIYIVDRKKDMINVRGLNVYPREIEEVLYFNPKIKEAAVVKVSDKAKGEIPKAVIVLKEREQADNHEIIHFLRERLAPYKIPRVVEFRDSLPKTSTGKILKRAIK